MKQVLNIKNKYFKNMRLNLLAPIIFFTFNFFIFGPLELYLTNENEFWFDFFELLRYIFFPAIIVMILLLLLVTIAAKYKKFILTLIFSLSLAMYIQGNYLMIDYGQINGKEINWEQFTYYGIFNTCFWLLMLLIPFLLQHFFKWFQNARTWISLAIIGVELITILILCLGSNNLVKENLHFTNTNLLSLSKKCNTVIFVLDMFDSSLYEEIINESKDFMFEDFTYYPDTLGKYPTTKGSLMYILTGREYYNLESFSAFREEGYLTNVFSQYKLDKRISTNPILSPINILKQVDNSGKDKYKLNSYVDFINTLYKLVSFKYFPHEAKSHFVLSQSDLNFTKVLKSGEIPYYSNDDYFMDQLIEKGIDSSIKLPTYRLYHLAGSHPPYIYDENLDKETSYEKSSIK